MADRFLGFERRFAAINLTTLLWRAAHHLEEQAGVAASDFAEALMSWGRDNEWRPDQ